MIIVTMWRCVSCDWPDCSDTSEFIRSIHRLYVPDISSSIEVVVIDFQCRVRMNELKICLLSPLGQ